MKTVGTVLTVLTMVACVSALGLGVYPGVLNDVLVIGIFLAIVLVPVAGIAALIIVVVLAIRGKLRGLRVPWSAATL